MWCSNLHCITGKSFIKIGPPIWGKGRESQARKTLKISPKKFYGVMKTFQCPKRQSCAKNIGKITQVKKKLQSQAKH